MGGETGFNGYVMANLIFLMMVVAATGISNIAFAQDSIGLSYATSVGLVKVTGPVNQVLQPGIAFRSEFEYITKKKWFIDVTGDFSAQKYNQQEKDSASPFLFQNSKSALFMIGINLGKRLRFLNKNCSISLYFGGGYLTIGEPRVNLAPDNIVRQTILHPNGIFGRLGSRVEYNTKIKVLQGVFLDVSGWSSPAKVQGMSLHGFSLFIGTRVQII
jgi:hypothetical protein